VLGCLPLHQEGGFRLPVEKDIIASVRSNVTTPMTWIYPEARIEAYFSPDQQQNPDSGSNRNTINRKKFVRTRRCPNPAENEHQEVSRCPACSFVKATTMLSTHDFEHEGRTGRQITHLTTMLQGRRRQSPRVHGGAGRRLSLLAIVRNGMGKVQDQCRTASHRRPTVL
jgi:hypothetical protein